MSANRNMVSDGFRGHFDGHNVTGSLNLL